MTATTQPAPRLGALHYVILAGVALFVVTALRALTAPEAASARFGLPLLSAGDDGFVRVYGLRNLALALIIGGLAITRQLVILRAIFTGLLLLPIGDALIIAAHHGWPQVPKLHFYIEVYFVIVCAWLWRQRA